MKNILLIQLHHLGDVILATPAARAAHAHGRVDFLTGKIGAQALEGNPHIDRVLVDPSWKELRAAKYDAVYDMHSIPPSALAAWMTRAKERVGVRGRGPRNLAYTKLLDKEHGRVYMARQKMRLLRDLGVNEMHANASLVINVTDEMRAKATKTLDDLGLFGQVVAISPVAKHEFKQWGATNWAAVGDTIVEMGGTVLITSGPGEEDQARAVAEAMKHPAVWRYGKTTVRELCALYSQCALWVGNDGGPKHIAVAAGTPTIAVYRGTLGDIWSDPANTKQGVINAGDGHPVTDITPERVVTAVVEHLRR